MSQNYNWIEEIKGESDFIYIAYPEDIEELVEDLSSADSLSLDVESYIEPKWKGNGGSALDPHTSRISLIALMSRESLPIIVDLVELNKRWTEDHRYLFVEFLKSKTRLYAFNAKYDLNMMRKEFGEIFDNFFCVRVLVKMVTNALGSKFARKCGTSLKDVLRDYLDIHMEGKGAEQISDWYPRPVDNSMISSYISKVRYAAGDIKYLFDIRDMLEPVITAPLPSTGILAGRGDSDMDEKEMGLDMSEALELEQKSQVPIAEMEWNGLPIALQAAEDFYGSLNSPSGGGELNRIGGILCQKLGIEWNLDYIPNIEYPIPRDHKPLRNPQVLKELVNKKLDLDLDNVQKSVLNRLLDLLAELEEVNNNEKEDIEWANEDEAENFNSIKQIDEGMISEYSSLIRLIIDYKHLDKVYGMKISNKINPVTGRVHATYDSMGASTSRSSSFKPNAQQINGRVKVVVECLRDSILDQPPDYLNDT